jgi:hypothetical protein
MEKIGCATGGKITRVYMNEHGKPPAYFDGDDIRIKIMQILYAVDVLANKFPHLGSYYDGVWLNILRVGESPMAHEPASSLTSATDDQQISYSIDFVLRQLFTHDEALEIEKTMMRRYGENIGEIRIEEIPLPLEGNWFPADVCGCGGCTDIYMFYKSDEWEGIEVEGYYDLFDKTPISSYKSFCFAPDGSMSGEIKLDAMDTQALFTAYQKAIHSGEGAKFAKVTKIEPRKPTTTFGSGDLTF